MQRFTAQSSRCYPKHLVQREVGVIIHDVGDSVLVLIGVAAILWWVSDMP